MDLEHEKRLTAVEERAKSNTHRIDRLEPIIREIHTMSETMVRLVAEIEHTNENVSEIKNKVESLEEEPAKRWRDSTKAVFNAFLGAIGTAAAGAIIFLLSNYI